MPITSSQPCALLPPMDHSIPRPPPRLPAPKTLRQIPFPAWDHLLHPHQLCTCCSSGPSLPTGLQATPLCLPTSLPPLPALPRAFGTCTAELYFSSFSPIVLLLPGILRLALVKKREELKPGPSVPPGTQPWSRGAALGRRRPCPTQALLHLSAR